MKLKIQSTKSRCKFLKPLNTNKTRGKYFEEKIVKEYRKYLGLSKLECYRSSSSGARTSLEVTGDISFNDPIRYPIITECKYRISISLDDLFPSVNNEIEKWITQNKSQIELFRKEFPDYNGKIYSSVIIGRPHQKVENYYTIITSQMNNIYGPPFQEKIISYSKKFGNILILNLENYLKFLKEGLKLYW